MKTLKIILIGTVICLSVISCRKGQNNLETIEVSGTIQKQEMTSYQYGTHTISGYALRSSSISFDDYINQSVTIVGKKIEGYPIDGGPDYLEVEQITYSSDRLFKGMFSYVANTDEVAFTECNQEFAISMTFIRERGFNSLFDAYKKVQSESIIDFAYVEFNGYIGDKKVATEMDDMKTIVITKFLTLDKNKSCK